MQQHDVLFAAVDWPRVVEDGAGLSIDDRVDGIVQRAEWDSSVGRGQVNAIKDGHRPTDDAQVTVFREGEEGHPKK